MHIELLSVAATAPGASGAAGVALSGDSLIVKNGRGNVRILSAWSLNQTAGFGAIISPSGHDSTRGWRFQCPAGANLGVLPPGIALAVQPQETLSITIAGSATAGDVEQLSMILAYDDLPGIGARLITANQLESRIEKLVTVEEGITSTAGPSYGTPELLNADSDLLKANRDYAVLGCTFQTACQAAYIVGPDTGNLRVGVPGDPTKPEITSQYFALLSRWFQTATIPVISSGNKGSTYIGVTANENPAAMKISWNLALLK